MRSGIRVRGASGLGAWRERVGAAFMRFEMEAAPRGRFVGTLNQLALGPLRLYDFAAPAHVVRRAPDRAGLDADSTILAVTQLEGECVYHDAAAQLRLEPGDVLFLQPARRFEMHFPAPMRLRVVAMPASLLAHGALAHRHFRGAVARADGGSTAIARTLLDAIHAHAGQLSAAEQQRMARHLVDMFETLAGSALLGTDAALTTPRAVLLARILNRVREQLADPALDAATIARALRISPRYLRALLQAHGTSLRLLLLQQRLERCREALLDPLHRHRTASDIAYAWGFNSSAHFTRVFRARYGLPPAGYRRRHGGVERD